MLYPFEHISTSLSCLYYFWGKICCKSYQGSHVYGKSLLFFLLLKFSFDIWFLKIRSHYIVVVSLNLSYLEFKVSWCFCYTIHQICKVVRAHKMCVMTTGWSLQIPLVTLMSFQSIFFLFYRLRMFIVIFKFANSLISSNLPWSPPSDFFMSVIVHFSVWSPFLFLYFIVFAIFVPIVYFCLGAHF